MEKEKKMVTAFIECYRQHPALWDIDSFDYMEKDKKDLAYAKLLEIYKTVKPDADECDVRRKISSLRSSYRREKRKIQKIKDSNSDCSDREDLSKLYWFKHFSFMEDIIERTKKTGKEEDFEKLFPEESQMSQNQMQNEQLTSFYEESATEAEAAPSYNNRFVDFISSPGESSKNQKPSTTKTNTRQQEYLPNDDTESVLSHEGNAEADIFARTWTLQYRMLNNDQRMFAKKAIDDILFEAKLGTLHRHSVTINENVCQHCQTAFINNEFC